MRHPDGRATTIPVHAGDVIGEKLLKSVLRQCGMTVEELKEIL
jgi:predicted RNA binding protein YcfA (HicA-like mRNA interferase family)